MKLIFVVALVVLGALACTVLAGEGGRRSGRKARSGWFGPVTSADQCENRPEGMEIQMDVSPASLCTDTATEICLCVGQKAQKAARRVRKGLEPVYKYKCATCTFKWSPRREGRLRGRN